MNIFVKAVKHDFVSCRFIGWSRWRLLHNILASTHLRLRSHVLCSHRLRFLQRVRLQVSGWLLSQLSM